MYVSEFDFRRNKLKKKNRKVDIFYCREENDTQSSLNNTKSVILSAALSFVPQHGWTKQSLILGMISSYISITAIDVAVVNFVKL